MYRAKSPTLKGLKILGKIDTDKIAKPVPKKKEDHKKEKSGTQAPSNQNTSQSASDEHKRKRKIAR